MVGALGQVASLTGYPFLANSADHSAHSEPCQDGWMPARGSLDPDSAASTELGGQT